MIAQHLGVDVAGAPADGAEAAVEAPAEASDEASAEAGEEVSKKDEE